MSALAEKNGRALSTLGLAARAGKTVCGTPAVCDALKEGKAKLVVSASGNSENTAKRLRDRCAFYGVTLIVSGADRVMLGTAVGKREGSAAVAVTDENLARAVSAVFSAAEKPLHEL